jgi:hypothetical protein
MSDIPTETEDDTQPSPEEQEPHDSPESWMVPARQDGVEWSDLASHVATGAQAASDDGHLDADIDKHLGYAGTDAITSRARTDFAAQPDAQADMESGKWKPFDPDWRQKYATALSNNEAKHPQDYADAVGAGALAEAHAAGGLPDNDPEAVETRKRRVAASAEALAGQLPHREEFIDASLELAPAASEEERSRVQKRLQDHWAETGQKPSDALLKAKADPEFRHSLWYEPFVHGVERNLIPGAGGFVGMTYGASLGAAVGGPLAPATAFVGALAGALIGSVATGYAQRKAFEATGIDKALGIDNETTLREQKASPYSSLAGELVGGGALFSPFSAGRSVLANIIGRSANAVISGGAEGVNEYMTEGRLDPAKIAMATGYGSLFPGINVAGRALEEKLPGLGRIMVRGIPTLSKDTGGAVGTATGIASNTPIEDAVHYDQLHGFAQRIAHDQSGEFKLPEWVTPEDTKRLAVLRAKEYIVNGDRVENPIRGQHASPHLFDHFSTKHLGEGEAAIARPQADIHSINERAHGHYISEAEGVHDYYMGTLSQPHVDGKPIDWTNPLHVAAHELQKADPSGQYGDAREVAIKNLTDHIKMNKDYDGDYMARDIDAEALKHLKSGADIPKITDDVHSYDVALHVDRKHLYDHDLPIEQQPEFVRQKLGVPEKPELKTGEGADEANAAAMQQYQEKLKESGWTEAKLKRTGYEHFQAMTRNLKSTKYATDALAKKGIPGVTYLDHDSEDYVQRHGIQPHEIDGLSRHNGGYLTHNHVIFHDTPVDMVKRDGSIMLPDHYKKDLEELAQSYHATGKMAQAFHAMMMDDSGAFNLGAFKKPAAAAAEDARSKRANLWMDIQWNRGLGRNVQAPLQELKVQIEPFIAEVNKLVPEFKKEMDTPGGNPMGTPLGNFYQFLEGRTKAAWQNMVNGTTSVVLHNSKLQPIVDMIGKQNEALASAYDALSARGLLTPKRWIDDYFVHIVEDPYNTGAMNKLQGMGFLGSSASQKARIYPQISDLLAAGFKLKFPNPLEAHAVAVGRALHMINKLDMVGRMQDAGWAGTSHSFGDPLNGVGMGDNTVYAHPTVAAMWNKMNTSFAFNEGEGSWFRSILHAANQTKAVKLIWAGVHMMQINMAAITNGAALALEATERGQVMLATRGLTHVIPGVGAADTWNLGRQVRNAIENDTGRTGPIWQKYGPDIEKLIDTNFTALTEGRSVNELVSDNRNLWESAVHNWSGDTLAEKWQGLAKATWAHELEALDHIWNGKDNVSPVRNTLMMPVRVMGHLGDIFGRVVQTGTESIFGTGSVLGARIAAIPNIKLGAAVLRTHSYLASNPKVTEEQLAQRMLQIRMDNENRFGELNQDTLFVPKLVKQLANLSMVSSGWKWGTWSNAFAAVGRNINAGRSEFNPVAMHSMIAQVVGWGIMGTLYQYLHTGTFPWQTDTPIRDLVNFRSGKDPAGNTVRGMQFGEQKEYFDIYKVLLNSLSDPMHLPAATAEYMLSATNPLFQAVYAHTLGGGVDPIGHHIANYPGGYLRYLKDNFGPIAQTVDENLHKQKETGLTDWEQVWLGNRPAPSYAADTAKYLKGIEARHAQWDKRELARARKEASHLEHPEWLEDYIAEKEEAMRNGGPAIHGFDWTRADPRRARQPGVNRRAF